MSDTFWFFCELHGTPHTAFMFTTIMHFKNFVGLFDTAFQQPLADVLCNSPCCILFVQGHIYQVLENPNLVMVSHRRSVSYDFDAPPPIPPYCPAGGDSPQPELPPQPQNTTPSLFLPTPPLSIPPTPPLSISPTTVYAEIVSGGNHMVP